MVFTGYNDKKIQEWLKKAEELLFGGSREEEEARLERERNRGKWKD